MHFSALDSGCLIPEVFAAASATFSSSSSLRPILHGLLIVIGKPGFLIAAISLDVATIMDADVDSGSLFLIPIPITKKW